jgi:hypothetical protein
MSRNASGDNDNPASAGVAAAQTYLSEIACVASPREMARFRSSTALLAVIFASLAFTASASPTTNQPWPVAICLSMTVFYMIMTGFAREIKNQQYA